MQHASHCLCLVRESTILYFTTHVSPLQPVDHVPALKTVLGRIRDTYQAYCNTFKTHTMATYHGGSRQPLDRVT